jgi:hypothetical protein
MNSLQGIPPPRDMHPLIGEWAAPLHSGPSTLNVLIVLAVLILLFWVARRVRYARLP